MATAAVTVCSSYERLTKVMQFVQHWAACVVGVQAHFSRGLSIGTEDFSIDDFDPCRKWSWPRCL